MAADTIPNLLLCLETNSSLVTLAVTQIVSQQIVSLSNLIDSTPLVLRTFKALHLAKQLPEGSFTMHLSRSHQRFHTKSKKEKAGLVTQIQKQSSCVFFSIFPWIYEWEMVFWLVKDMSLESKTMSSEFNLMNNRL